MITVMDGALLTNSQEQQLFGELRLNMMNMDDLQLSVSDLQSFSDTNSQKYSNSQSHQQYAICSTEDADNKAALHQSLAILPSYELEHQQIHQQMHIQKQEMQQQPLQLYQQVPSIATPIGKDEFPGPFNFKLILNSEGTGKHYVFSEKLVKVFIHMEEVLPLQFQWTPPNDGFWLRATLVYKSDQYRSEPVIRCHNHMAPINASNRDINQNDLKHVVRCLHSTSIYQENTTTKHLSVVTPLGIPGAGMNHVPVDYKFFCKNSCTHGMNRRATEIIFTLEDDQNNILGRQKLEIRVCSCPKRDKDKEEMECFPQGSVISKPPLGKKRKMPQGANHAPMKKKPAANQPIDQQVHNVNLQVLGQENVLAILKYASDVMSGCAVKTDNLELYKPYIDQIQNEIQRHE